LPKTEIQTLCKKKKKGGGGRVGIWRRKEEKRKWKRKERGYKMKKRSEWVMEFQLSLAFILSSNFFSPLCRQNLVNWGKIALIHRIIRNTIKFQGTGYDFSTNHELQQTLRSLPVLPEEKLYELSLMHEPRNAPKQDIK
jgi:hypothetical protein